MNKDTRKNHYVPVSYQSVFRGTTGSTLASREVWLGVTRLLPTTGKLFHAKTRPTEVGYMKDLFSPYVEHKLLGYFDAKGSEVHKSVVQQVDSIGFVLLTAAELRILTGYLLSIVLRHPMMLPSFSALTADLLPKEYAGSSFQSVLEMLKADVGQIRLTNIRLKVLPKDVPLSLTAPFSLEDATVDFLLSPHLLMTADIGTQQDKENFIPCVQANESTTHNWIQKTCSVSSESHSFVYPLAEQEHYVEQYFATIS
jgi:hypothetical protein